MLAEKIQLKPIVDSIKLLDISDEEYFSSKYKDYISNSRLKLINPDQGGSPQLYKQGLESSVSDSLYFGSAVHEMVLQPEDFAIVDSVDRPTAKMGFVADYLFPIWKSRVLKNEDFINASDAVGWYKGKMNQDKIELIVSSCESYWKNRHKLEDGVEFDMTPIYLDAKSREKLYTCLASIEANNDIQSLLYPTGLLETPISKNEATLLMEVEASLEDKTVVLPLKAKIDNFTANLETNVLTLNDLKTTGHWLADFKEDSFVKYHYSRQMAMYNWMLMLYAKKELKMENPEMYANMLVVCTCPDYRAGVCKVYNREIKEGFKEFKRLLQMVAYCELNGWNDESMGTNS